MSSRKDEESPNGNTSKGVRSLVSMFEGKGLDAEGCSRSLPTDNDIPKSTHFPDKGKEESRSPKLEAKDRCHETVNSSNKEYDAKRPFESSFAEHISPEPNNSLDNREKENRSPGFAKRSNLPKGETKMAIYESMEVFQKPLCLIETDTVGKMKAHRDVLAQISQIDHPLNIVCIAGPYRTGKSYLLTRLTGFNKGFALGSTIQSKTKGIWVWCRPHPIKMDQVLLLLDTEGLGDIEKGDKNNDNQILALGILLSSTFVYNILSKFSTDDLEKLSFVTEISKNIKFSEKMSIEESSSNFDRIFPTFILSLRDFTLLLEHDGKPITSDEYLEKVCLKLQPETSQKNRDNNRAPLRLMEYFKTRKCFTFDTPGLRNVLSRLEDVQDSELSEDFVKETKLFTDYVYNECLPKQMNNGQPVNGRRLVILTEQYVGAIRDGKVPNVVDALATMVHLENTRAIDGSVKIYVSGMQKLEYPTPDSITLSAEHKRCFDHALDFFWGNSMYDEQGNYYDRANSLITKEYENFRTRDQEESEKKSKEVLEGMNVVIKQKLKDGCYHRRDGYKLYLKDMQQLEADYSKLTGLGCKKTDMLNKYLSDTATRGQIIMQADETLTKKEKEMEDKRQKVAEAERQLAAEKSFREKQERLLKEETSRMKKAFEQQMQKCVKELQNERDHLAKLMEQRREEKERLEKEGLMKEAERVKSNMEKIKNELHEYKNEGFVSLLGRAAKELGSKLIFWKA